MTHYLLTETLPQILERWYSAPGMREQRLMGPELVWDSGYFDIYRFFGPNAVDPRRITIEYNNSPFRIPDPALAQFTEHVASQMRAEGRLYDGPLVMKYDALEKTESGFVMQVRPTSYADQAGSCFALDWPTEHFGPAYRTAREYVMHKYGAPTGQANPLAICLGVCGMVILEEEGTRYLVKIHRSGKLASLENSTGPSVAGSVDWSTESRTLAKLLHVSLASELREELGIDPAKCRITPLALATEIFRGEKPQLFGLIECSMSRAELLAQVAAIPTSDREFDDIEFQSWDKIDTSGAKCMDEFNFEARANTELLREYSRQV